MKRFLFPVIILSLLFVAAGVHADVTVTLSLGANTSTLNDSVHLVVSVNGSRNTSSQPDIQGLENFRVTSGGTSSRMEIINGQYNSAVDYTYYLQPREMGLFEIGPARVDIKGKTYLSNKATLKVVKASQKSDGESAPLLLRAEVSSDTLFLEQQAVYTLKLYLRARVSDVSLNLPEVDGLAFKKLSDPTEYQGVYEGQSYRIFELRYAVIPEREGDYSIPPARMSMTLYDQQRGGRDSFFEERFFSFAQGRPVELASNPLTLKITPLPETGRPGDFSGLVGSFSMTSKCSPLSLKTGESATLTARISGSGNVNSIPDLAPPKIENVKIYTDQPVLETKTDSEGFHGSKTMKWALVFEKEGVYRIPPLALSYFDPKEKAYRQIKTDPYEMTVTPGEKKEIKIAVNTGPAAPPKNGSKQEVKQLGRDILPIHASLSYLSSDAPGYGRKLLMIPVLLAPLVIFLGLFGVALLRKQSGRTVVAQRSKKAAGNFYRKAKSSHISSRDMTLAVRDYLNERFVLNAGSLTPSEAGAVVEARGAKKETVRELESLLQRLENAVYTGNADEACPLCAEMAQVIKRIEEETR